MARVKTIQDIPLRSWADTKSVSEQIKPKRTRANPPINNELFTYVADYIEDEYWKEKLLEAKRGIFPGKISYINGVLQYKTVNETYSIMFDTESRDQNTLINIGNEFISFYQKTVHMFSPSDIAKREAIIFDKSNEEEDYTWTKLKRAQVNITLYNFALQEKRKWSLSSGELLKLRQLLRRALILRYINNSSVVLDKQSIAEQTFIAFDPVTRVYTLNDEVRKMDKTKSCCKKRKIDDTYSLKWIDYCGKMSTNNVRVYRHPVRTNNESEGTTEN